MTLFEFSSQFDTLYNNISSNQAPGLNEYEKSLFLTQAQDQLVENIYSGRDIKGPFEVTEEARRYLSNLIEQVDYIPQEDQMDNTGFYIFKFQLPDNLLYITYEECILKDESTGCHNNSSLGVVPVTQDQFYKIKRNPFKGANINKVLRLDGPNNTIEIYSKYQIGSYQIKYIKKPKPIILINLQTEMDGLTIKGLAGPQECELSEIAHKDILTRAVFLAKQYWQGMG